MAAFPGEALLCFSLLIFRTKVATFSQATRAASVLFPQLLAAKTLVVHSVNYWQDFVLVIATFG